MLTSELAAARLATAKYATNLAKAKADGYQIITKMMPNMGFHFMNPHITGFNVRKPQILVYEHTRTAPGSSAPWSGCSRDAEDPAAAERDVRLLPGGAATTRTARSSRTRTPRRARRRPRHGAKFTFWHPDLITMHVWVWYPNPAGLYSSTNPLVAPFNGN